MKKIFFYITLITLTAATVGCSKSDIDDIQLSTTIAGERINATATIAGSEQTRVTLTPDEDDATKPFIKVDWNTSGEEFAVVNGDNTKIFTQSEGNLFAGILPSGTATYVGIYPASAASQNGIFTIDIAEQTGELDENKTFMLSDVSNTGLSYSFKHATALLNPSFKVGDNALSNEKITKIVVKNTTAESSINCFDDTQSTHTVGNITITRTTPSLEDIYIYICKEYNEGENIVVWVYTEESGAERLYEGVITIPAGKSLEMGKLYTPTVSLTEIAAPNTILYFGTEKATFANEENYNHTFTNGVGHIITKDDSDWTTLPVQAFFGTEGITKVILPETVTKIDKQAFNGVTSLTEVIMPGVTTIENAITAADSNEYGVFEGCTELTRVVIPAIKSIGKKAFQNCTKLTDIDLSNVEELGDYSFDHCSALTNVNLPMIKKLGGHCFSYCNNLSEVRLGANITDIGQSAFISCPLLKSVTIEATTPPALGGANPNNCFQKCSTDLKIRVPGAALNSYRSGWSGYVPNDGNGQWGNGIANNVIVAIN